jgi:exopolysaccharide biosynthesis polyprenyl glycosylphosphotransferase
MTPREALDRRVGASASADPNAAAAPAHDVRALARVLTRGATARQPRWWRDALRRRMLAMADSVAAATASLVAASSMSAGGFWAVALLPLWILLAKLLGLYDRDHRAIRHLTVDELPSIAAWAASGVALVVLLLPLTPAGSISAGAAMEGFAAGVAAAFILRGGARWLWRRVTPAEVTAVVGEGDLARAVRRKVELFSDMHLVLAAEVEADLATAGGEGDGAEELEALASRVDRLIVASERVDPELIGRLAAVCRTGQVKLSVVSPLRGRAGPTPLISQVADLPVLEYDTWDVSRSTQLLKRAFDIVVSGAALLLLAPFLPLIALAIRLDSRGPVFFTQLRAGLDGTPFRMVKFRTMRADAEEALSEVVSLDELREPMFKIPGDPRVTRFGRLLRRFSLDELPQLFNVLRGQMSIVGPRPEQIELVERYRPEHRFRLQVKPGMTGPMQVFGRGELTFAERLAVELDYVENISLTRDLRILFHTVPAIIRGTGAY